MARFLQTPAGVCSEGFACFLVCGETMGCLDAGRRFVRCEEAPGRARWEAKVFTRGNPKWNNKDIIFFFLRRIYEVMSFDGGTALVSPSGVQICEAVKMYKGLGANRAFLPL